MDGPAFLARVAAYREEGWRLAVVNATPLLPTDDHEHGAFDVTWSFARGGEFEHLRELVLPTDEVPSVSGSFASAFLYENELRELFGINVTGMAVDLGGQLYKTASRVPFSPTAIRARLEANGKASPKSGRTASPGAGGTTSPGAGGTTSPGAGTASPDTDGATPPGARRDRP